MRPRPDTTAKPRPGARFRWAGGRLVRRGLSALFFAAALYLIWRQLSGISWGAFLSALAATSPWAIGASLLLQTTQNIGTLEVRHLPRAAGRTNYTFRRLVRLFLSMFLNFSVMPLRMAAIGGFVMSGLGLIGFVAVFVEAIFVGQTPSGWASLMSAFLLLAGVQLIILGLMGEYLGRLYGPRAHESLGA